MGKKSKPRGLTPETPINAGNLLSVLAIALAELQRELVARRQFDDEVAAWLKANPAISESLEEWQRQRQTTG